MPVPLAALPERYRQRLPRLTQLVMVLAFAGLFAWQAEGWWALTRPVPAEAPIAAPLRDLEGGGNPVAALFGLGDSAPPATRALPAVILHGSFAHPDPARASAIVEVDGEPARLVRPGESIAEGVEVGAIHADRIELVARGETVSIPLPRAGDAAPEASPPPAADRPRIQAEMEALERRLSRPATGAPERGDD